MIAVEYRFGFNGFQAERPMDMPEILHPLGCPILKAQILIQSIHCRDGLRRAAAPIQPGRHTVISELGMIADPRPVDIRILKRSVRVDHHFNHNGQAILIEIQ